MVDVWWKQGCAMRSNCGVEGCAARVAEAQPCAWRTCDMYDCRDWSLHIVVE